MTVSNKKIEFILAKFCLSAKDLSRLSGVSVVTLTRIKNGSQKPNPKTIGKLAKALEIDVTELIEE